MALKARAPCPKCTCAVGNFVILRYRLRWLQSRAMHDSGEQSWSGSGSKQEMKSDKCSGRRALDIRFQVDGGMAASTVRSRLSAPFLLLAL